MAKWITLCCILLIAVLQLRLFGKGDGVREVLRLKQNIALQTQEVERLQNRNQKLDQEIQGLKNFPEALEERARAELGMIKENETFCLVVEPNH